MITRSFRAEYTEHNPCDTHIHELPYKQNGQCSYNIVTIMEWNVDRREQQFLPTAAVGIKLGIPLLEFFGTYGKSWRPPAITEVLVTGSSHGHGWSLPNPFLASER